MLKSLLWKDLRLLSIYLILGVILSLIGYGACSAMVFFMPRETLPSLTLSYRAAMVLSGGSIAGLWFGAVGCALLAGNAFAAERMDRSALFLDCLPPTRQQVLICKLAVVVGFSLVLFLSSISAAAVARSLVADIPVPRENVVDIKTILGVCKILVGVTGISFAVSAFAKSNGAPILLGLCSPLMVLAAVKSVDFLLDLPVRGETLFPRIANSCLVLGLASLIMGSWSYVNQRYEI